MITAERCNALWPIGWARNGEWLQGIVGGRIIDLHTTTWASRVDGHHGPVGLVGAHLPDHLERIRAALEARITREIADKQAEIIKIPPVEAP